MQAHRYLWNYSIDHDPTNPTNIPTKVGDLFRSRSAAVRAAKEFCKHPGGDHDGSIAFSDDMVAEIDTFSLYPRSIHPMKPDHLTLTISRRAAAAILPLIAWLDTHIHAGAVDDTENYDVLINEIERQTRAFYDSLKKECV